MYCHTNSACFAFSVTCKNLFFPAERIFPCCSINDHFNIFFCLSVTSQIFVSVQFSWSHILSLSVYNACCQLKGNAFSYSFFVITKNSFNLLKHFWVVSMVWYGIETLLLCSKSSCALCLPSDNISNKKPNTNRMKGILSLLGPVWLCIMKICKNKLHSHVAKRKKI